MTNAKRSYHHAVFFTAILLCFCGLFYLSYKFDNKYTVKSPQPANAVLNLDESTLERYPVFYPILDWEIYRGRLLTPEDFEENPPFPDELVFIGQYGGFEGRVESSVKPSPHGSATYRLNIFLPETPDNYTIELPEIYSAYRLYINGNLVKEVGQPEPERYLPQTVISSVSLPLSGRVEILFAVTDYTNIYSGMVYPLAFGKSANIAMLLNRRMILRAAAIITALVFSLLNLIVRFYSKGAEEKGRRSILLFFYAALCFFFAVYISPPIVKSILTVRMGFYVFERFSFCAILLLVTLIRGRLSGDNGIILKAFVSFGIFACIAALFVPLSFGGSYSLMMAYSYLIWGYTALSAIYLTISTVRDIYTRGSGGKLLLVGLICFNSALVMDIIFPMYEPILFGWFMEIAGAVLVCTIGIALARDIGEKLKQRQAIEARMESVSKVLEVQKTYYPLLLEKEKETQAARHDLRHHISAMQVLLSEGETKKLRAYLSEYSGRQIPGLSACYCRHYVTDMLLRMYAGLAEKQNIPFTVNAAVPESLPLPDTALCVILSNTLENALEASAKIPQEERSVKVFIGILNEHFCLSAENIFDEKLTTKDGRFISHKAANRDGIGILSVCSAVTEHGGTADFYPKGKHFFSEICVPLRSPESGGSS